MNDGLLDAFDLAMRKSDTTVAQSTHELWGLVNVVFHDVDPQSCVVVIDGLDECSSANDMATRFSALARESDVKVIILGRSSSEGLQKGLTGYTQISLTPAVTNDDIEKSWISY